MNKFKLLIISLVLIPTVVLGQTNYNNVGPGTTAPAGVNPPDTGGVINSEQFISTPSGGYTLTSQTAAQQLFASPAGGALTVLGNTTYEFEGWFSLTSLAASGGFGFAIGGSATITDCTWISMAAKNPLTGNNAITVNFNASSVANTSIVGGDTNTTGYAYITGVCRINASGTFIPEVSLGTAAAAVVGYDSFFRLKAIGSGTIVSKGNWN